jgi:hypothetical protein
VEQSVVQFAVTEARTVSSRFPGSDWYLFGSSARNPEHAGDIDLLIVHDGTIESTSLRTELAALCMVLPLHLTILTRAEESELNFIARADGCRKIGQP